MTATAVIPGSATMASVPRVALRALAVRDFRNLDRADLAIPADGLVVVGENGQGKTNLLEAIYYLPLLRSFRAARDADLTAFGAAGFYLAAEIDGAAVRSVSVGFERSGKGKRVRVDGGEPERLSDALGSFPAVIFSPQDGELVSGAPSIRRRFLDVVLALTSRSYLTALQRYRSALAQRNAALRAALVPGARADAEARVAVWEPALASHGAVLFEGRRQWVQQHGAHFGPLCRAIGEAGEARLRYVSALEGATSPEQALADALARKRGLDLRRGVTHAGPHRDDLALTLDGRELRTFGSAGQQRTAAIALRLLEGATLRERTGREPIVLLDDPFAELDARRAASILELLDAAGRGQTVLVVPRSTDIPRPLIRLERWRIAAGVLAAAAP